MENRLPFSEFDRQREQMEFDFLMSRARSLFNLSMIMICGGVFVLLIGLPDNKHPGNWFADVLCWSIAALLMSVGVYIQLVTCPRTDKRIQEIILNQHQRLLQMIDEYNKENPDAL